MSLPRNISTHVHRFRRQASGMGPVANTGQPDPALMPDPARTRPEKDSGLNPDPREPAPTITEMAALGGAVFSGVGMAPITVSDERGSLDAASTAEQARQAGRPRDPRLRCGRVDRGGGVSLARRAGDADKGGDGRRAWTASPSLPALERPRAWRTDLRFVRNCEIA
jgi:hypothetical protein